MRDLEGDRPTRVADSVSPDSTAPGQEFLFHLYRGSALLEDNQVDEAKGELEQALSLQPRDPEGQSLLGTVYFRLGHYPRAIHIFEDLITSRPREIAPKVNLALCYLKTGQLREARILLEDVVTARPDHPRAWGYLGLTFQRLGDFDKAAIAFERAGRPGLAARLRAHDSERPIEVEGIEAHADAPVSELSPGDARAAFGADDDVPGPTSVIPDDAPRSVRAGPLAPGTDVVVPQLVGRFLRQSQLVFPENPRVVVHRDGSALVRVETAFAFRPDAVIAMTTQGEVSRRPAFRRTAVEELREPLGGSAHPMTWLDGLGTLVLTAPSGRRTLALAATNDHPLFIREELLLGLELTVDYISGRLPLSSVDSTAVVKVTGTGVVLVSVPEEVRALAVQAAGGTQVRADRVVGWAGHLIASADEAAGATAGIRGLLTFSGEGSILLDIG